MSTGVVVWLTGKPSCGKSTLGKRVQQALAQRGTAACLLDGDEVRRSLVPPPGYDSEARDGFYATLANLAALLARQGFVVLVPATAHARAFRERARSLAPRFVEVFVDVPQGELERRDAKGLYAAVHAGDLTGVPGADLPYEPPAHPDVVASGGKDERAIEAIVSLL